MPLISSISIQNLVNTSLSESGYASEIEKLESLEKTARLRSLAKPAKAGEGDESKRQLDRLVDSFATQQRAELFHMSEAMALKTLVLGAAAMAERARNLPDPREKFEQLLQENLNGKSGAERTKAVEKLGQGVDKMVISLVHTMHPTVYHSTSATAVERELVAMMSDENAWTQGQRLNEEAEHKISDIIKDYAEKIRSGAETLTPIRPTSVAEESEIERQNWKLLEPSLQAVLQAWNETVAASALLGEEEKTRLSIDEEKAQKIYELRSWGNSADADGREKSTSKFLYESIHDASVEGEYQGKKLDLRQNAEIHRNAISALIQAKHRDSSGTLALNGEDVPNPATGRTFAEYCDDFMQARSTKLEYQNGQWDGPKKSIFQQLTENDRFTFIENIARAGYDLVPAQLEKDVADFNAYSYALRQKLIYSGNPEQPALYEAEIKAQGYNPQTITYQDMIRITVQEEIKGSDETAVMPNQLSTVWEDALRQAKFELSNDGLHYTRIPKRSTDDKTLQEKIDIRQEWRMKKILKGTQFLDANGERQPLKTEDRFMLMDTVKRLRVLADEIGEEKNSPIADRYQIANFSEAADFMILLKLFEEGGIAKIENGEVTQTKMGIMPLLETGEDLEKAEKIFSQILDSKLAQSYFKARGEALGENKPVMEFMVGFSDGAASRGNFESQRLIAEKSAALIRLGESRGVSVRILQGPGAGTDRGGVLESPLAFQRMEPEFFESGRYDATIQSNMPMDLATSPELAQDYVGGLLVGTLNATLRPTPLLEPEREAAMKKACEWIGAHATAIYQEKIRNNKDALAFFNGSPEHPYKSSRAAIRGGAEAKVFDKVRAIPKEFFSEGADMVFHNVGLKEALQAFKELTPQQLEEQGMRITTKNGTAVSGLSALSTLHELPFFQTQSQLVRAGMQHFDPAIALAYGEMAEASNPKYKGAKAFAETVVESISGLSGLLSYCDPAQNQSTLRQPATDLGAQDVLAHAATLALAHNNHDKTRYSENNEIQTMAKRTSLNLQFVNAQEHNRRTLTPPYLENTAFERVA